MTKTEELIDEVLKLDAEATPDDESHQHSSSIYLCCRECHLFGVPLPNDVRCGNCGSYDTFKLYPICCVNHYRTAAPILAKVVGELVRHVSKQQEKYGHPPHGQTNSEWGCLSGECKLLYELDRIVAEGLGEK